MLAKRGNDICHAQKIGRWLRSRGNRTKSKVKCAVSGSFVSRYGIQPSEERVMQNGGVPFHSERDF